MRPYIIPPTARCLLLAEPSTLSLNQSLARLDLTRLCGCGFGGGVFLWARLSKEDQYSVALEMFFFFNPLVVKLDILEQFFISDFPKNFDRIDENDLPRYIEQKI